MKTLKKIVLLVIVLLISLLFTNNFSMAEAQEVEDEAALRSAIESAPEQETTVINLTKNIELTSPIQASGKTIIINGNGNSIGASATNWKAAGNNSTLLTAGAGAKFTLNNLILKNSPKYGVQAYNGGYVVLNDVTIRNCRYGGVLVNAGAVEVQDLKLGRNGDENNNGIEIAKGLSIDTGENQPTLIMNGTLTSSDPENVIYLAVNDNLTNFEVKNEEGTTDKILISDNQVVIVDPQNKVLYKSNAIDDLAVQGETFVPNDVTVTIHLNNKTVTVPVRPGSAITEKELNEKIDLKELGLKDYKLAGFFTDTDFKKAFDFKTQISEDTDIYVKLEKIKADEPKDNSPKTGNTTLLASSCFVALSAITALVILKRKEL